MKISNLYGFGQMTVPSTFRPAVGGGSPPPLVMTGGSTQVSPQAASALNNYKTAIAQVVAACARGDQAAAKAAAQKSSQLAPSDRSISPAIMAAGRMFAEDRAGRPFCEPMAVGELRRFASGSGFATTMPALPPTVRPDAPLPVQTADKFPPNPNIPWQKWNARPSDAFLIEHHAVDNVRSWFKNALNELRIDQLQPIVDYYRTGTVPPGTRSVEVLIKYKPIILEYAAGRGIAVPELSTVPAATTVTPPAAQTKVDEVGTSLIPVSTVEEFRQANPMQQVGTGRSASMAAPEEGMSTTTKMVAGVVVAAVAYTLWKRRQA